MSIQKQKTLLLSLDQKIDYKDIDLLKLFITDQDKILALLIALVNLRCC